jgi:hypothetical protein
MSFLDTYTGIHGRYLCCMGSRAIYFLTRYCRAICLQVGLTGSDVLYGVDTVLASTVSYILQGGCHGVRAEDCLPSCHSSIPTVGVSKYSSRHGVYYHHCRMVEVEKGVGTVSSLLSNVSHPLFLYWLLRKGGPTA